MPGGVSRPGNFSKVFRESVLLLCHTVKPSKLFHCFTLSIHIKLIIFMDIFCLWVCKTQLPTCQERVMQ